MANLVKVTAVSSSTATSIYVGVAAIERVDPIAVSLPSSTPGGPGPSGSRITLMNGGTIQVEETPDAIATAAG